MSAQTGAVGILAGGGPLPARVAEAAAAAGRPVFILGFEGFAEPEVIAPWPHETVRLGAAGRMLSLLRAHGCTDLVLIGPIRRPSLRSLYPDAEGARILARLGRALFAGDDGLLAALVRLLGEEGFTVRGAHEFLAQSVARPGVLGGIVPDEQAKADIQRGIEVVQALGRMDIGQGCVVQNGLVLAVEAMEGTDRMLARAGECRQPGDGGVLVKMLKPGQEKRADMPTIGPATVRNADAAGLKGIAFEAGHTLMTDREACIAAADQAGLFLIAITPETFAG
ncbi:UDP-2,3-diacylglucosamine pyrophosphatase [Acetobacter senegalensis]|uniref:UDP-2,3-diacylglucosamine pyrophosphatase n=1 Tax=Acetobacter senegalensis TaxID=446692 RepID=A0A149U534_9PROT|nr:UDP-2,3-diacylglucosamine diphosphatase LpxI [Acetobacter senegalensis]KXV60528.1 UDP-2,3-diacylglucosamine pyrophosphatase [Acetobacter senegalensis]